MYMLSFKSKYERILSHLIGKYWWFHEPDTYSTSTGITFPHGDDSYLFMYVFRTRWGSLLKLDFVFYDDR